MTLTQGHGGAKGRQGDRISAQACRRVEDSPFRLAADAAGPGQKLPAAGSNPSALRLAAPVGLNCPHFRTGLDPDAEPAAGIALQ